MCHQVMHTQRIMQQKTGTTLCPLKSSEKHTWVLVSIIQERHFFKCQKFQ
jgi:hypothetical protein